MKTTHYGLTQADLRAIHKKPGADFETAKSGFAHLCGNGDYHASNTRDEYAVTCAACKAKLSNLRSN